MKIDIQKFIRDVGIILAIGFVVMIGTALIIDAYYHYLDNTEYYKIISPAKTEKATYKVCDKVGVLLARKTIIDSIPAKSFIQLLLVDINNKVVDTFQLSVVLPETHGEILTTVTQIPIPCNLANGEYYFKGVVTYQIRGYDHTEDWFSDTFKVVQK